MKYIYVEDVMEISLIVVQGVCIMLAVSNSIIVRGNWKSQIYLMIKVKNILHWKSYNKN